MKERTEDLTTTIDIPPLLGRNSSRRSTGSDGMSVLTGNSTSQPMRCVAFLSHCAIHPIQPHSFGCKRFAVLQRRRLLRDSVRRNRDLVGNSSAFSRMETVRGSDPGSKLQ